MGKSAESETDGRLATHPVLRKVSVGARSIAGYVKRPGSAEGTIQLYPSLANLDQYFEFNEADVLHHEENPDLPGGGMTVWLKPESIVASISVTRAPMASLPNRSRPRSKLYLSLETVRALTQGALGRGTRVIPVTNACLSGEGRCTEGASDCVGCTGQTTWINTDAGCTQTLGAATCGSVNLSCMGQC